MAIVGGAAIAGTAAIGSSVIGSNAAQSAANTQAAASENATAAELGMFNTVQQNLAPYMGAGTNALNALQGFLGIGGQSFGPNGSQTGLGTSQFQFNPASDPEYQFMLSQGLGAITNQASALGGVNSGATLKALSDYGQQSAQSAYQTEFNNWNTQLNNIFSRLTGVTQLGQTSAAGVGNAALTTGQSIGSNIIGAGNAQAAGTIGSANAFSGGIQSIFNSPAFTQLLTNSGGGGSTGYGNPIGITGWSPSTGSDGVLQ
jgi:hypothetical protein